MESGNQLVDATELVRTDALFNYCIQKLLTCETRKIVKLSQRNESEFYVVEKLNCRRKVVLVKLKFLLYDGIANKYHVHTCDDVVHPEIEISYSLILSEALQAGSEV